MAQLVKNLPAMQETLVRFLGGEHPLVRRGYLTVKEFQRPISGSCQGAPTPRGEALAGWASPRSTLSSQL